MRPETDGTTQSPLASPGLANGSSNSPLHKAPISNVLNGSSNGTVMNNGMIGNGDDLRTVQSTQPTFFGHDREEVTRILIQALSDLGYQSAAGSLSRESGFNLETPYASAFRTAVLHGDWSEAEALLLGTYPHDDGGGVGIEDSSQRPNAEQSGPNQMNNWSHSNVGGLALAQDADKDEMLFLIRQQKYLELLERRDLGAALMVLRQELQPLHQDERQLHALSSLIMCQSSDDLKFEANWDGALGQSRRRLLSDLSRSISPSAMIPEHRLPLLLHQVKEYQILNAAYDNSRDQPSLYTDHTADRDDFPLNEVLALDQHKDEVWFLQFSNDGTRLATASKDETVVIYDTVHFQPVHILSSHRKEIAYVAWSPDDTKLISCSQDKQARLWDTKTGVCLRIIAYHKEPVTTAAWSPDGLSFVTGSLDIEKSLCLWNVNDNNPTANPVHSFSTGRRIQDCAVATLQPAHSRDSPYSYDSLTSHHSAADGALPVRLIAISTEKDIHIFDYARRVKLVTINMIHELTSLSLSRDGREMLVNLSCDEVWALNVEEPEKDEIRQVFRGQSQGKYVIRSAFGGAREGVVISGGEDSKICIWHRHTGRLLERLSGHATGCVNAVAWNSANNSMFASAGDDCKVRIWSKSSIPLQRSPPQLELLPNWGSLREATAAAAPAAPR